MPFLMIRDDIVNVCVDAVVNPANENLLEGSGTSRAIYLAAGEEKLENACRRIGHCAPGRAVITKGFDLPAKYVIHAVGPLWMGGNHKEEEMLYSAYRESLMLARRHRLKSIAFPLLSAGSYHYPKEQALKTAVRAISDFLMEHEMLVYLVLYDRSAVSISRKLVDSIEEYIDDHYVEIKDEHLEGDRGYPDFNRDQSFVWRECKNEQLSGAERPEPLPGAAGMPLAGAARMPLAGAPKRSLEQLLAHMDETFSQMLLRLIDERGLKDSAVYRKANVDRRHFSKIRNDVNYAPNKKTVLAFAIALELSLDETKDLLNRAGFALSGSSRFDVIISFFIENHQYNIFEINEALFAYGQPLLGQA